MDTQLEVRDFSEGVQTGLAGDQIPNNALTSGSNTAFRNVGTGKPLIGSRPGLLTLNDVPLTSAPVVHFMHPYAYDNGTSHIKYLAISSNDGKLYFKDSTDAIVGPLVVPANYPYTSSLAFTAGNYRVDGTVVDNMLFLVNDNGERRALAGTTYVPFGIETPATAITATTSAGSTILPNDTYEISYTFYNSTTGAESSRSTAASVTTSGNQRIRLGFTISSADVAQYTHWRAYIRRTSTQSKFYQVLNFYDSSSVLQETNGNVAISVTPSNRYVEMTAAQISNLITEAPSTSENNPPLTSVKFCTTYGNRLFLADRSNIYWSNLNKPHGFNPLNVEPINTGEGDQVTGIHKFSDELLLIFTDSATIGLFGNDPQTWVFKPIDNAIGSVSHRAVVDYDGRCAWWDNAVGPIEFDGQAITQIGNRLLGPDKINIDVEHSRGIWFEAAHQAEGNRIVFSYSTNGATRNDCQIVFNYQLNRWESDCWDGIDAASLASAYDSNGNEKLFLGGYAGQLFKYDSATYYDGIVDEDSTVTVDWVPTATSTTVIDGLTNFTGFYNTNGKLTERKVTIVDSNNRPFARARITSNTSTALTVSEAISGLAVGSTYTLYIGSPDVRIYTKWYDFDLPFQRKRVDRLYLHAFADAGSEVSVQVGTQVNFVNSLTPVQQTLNLTGSAWDEGIWDSAYWGGSGNIKRRLSILRTCMAFRALVFHPQGGEDFVLSKIASLARVLDDRYDS